MSGTTDNIWGREIDDGMNVWGNSHDNIETQSPRSGTRESKGKSPSNDEINDVPSQGAGKSASTDSSSVKYFAQEEDIDLIDDVEHAEGIANNVWTDVQPTEISSITEDPNTNNEVTAIPEQSDEVSDEFEDDFGDFEEMPTEKLNFDRPVTELLCSIFPNCINDSDPEDDANVGKSLFLIEGGVRPMKCYNTIVANDRQYLSDKIPVLNTRQRGCIEKMALRKAVLGVVGEWIYDEKGIYKKDADESTNSSWRGAGKNGIFRWSTKTESEPKTEKDKNNRFRINERKIIGQKLLYSSFEQARRIIEERSESEKREKMILEKAKWEREQKLKKEKLKKEEELEKYNVEHAKVSDKKKKGFFGKMFSGKSKIAKDHLSHKKITPNDDDSFEKNELSLMEQLEREGYDLSQGESKKRRSKKAGSRKVADDNDDEYDDDDDDNDDDDDYSNGDNTPNGYNVLDPNGAAGSEKVNVLGEERDAEGSDGINGETEVENTVKNPSVEPNTHSPQVRKLDAEGRAGKEVSERHGGAEDEGSITDNGISGVENHESGNSSSNEDNDQETFDDFQVSGPPIAETQNLQSSQPSRDDYLIDL